MSILDRILKEKKEEVKILKRDFPKSRFADSEFFEKKALDFTGKLDGTKRLAIIAEIKKASPSKGIIKKKFNHIEIANIYFENDVDAVSILTDEKFFEGNIKYLNEIAEIKSTPILRKDFIIDETQVYQSKSAGADLILLIAEILSAAQITELTAAAAELGLEVLLELHSKEQLAKINFSKNILIGINNRDLNTFQVDLSNTVNICKLLPGQVNVISESGIKTKSDVEILKQKSTVSGILVGEHLMKSKNLDSSIKELKDWCVNES